jgi:hypothetical protein
MSFKRVGTDVLSVVSLLAVLAAVTEVFDLIGLPVGHWISGTTGTASTQAVEQGQGMASQALGLTYAGGVLLAGYVGGRFLRGRPRKIRIGYFVSALLLMGIIWVAGEATGLLVPMMIGGRIWPVFPLFLMFLSIGWAYGTKSIGETSRAAETGASAGGAAGEAGAYAVKHRQDVLDFFN